jgi:hypothetical protein
MLKLKLKNPPSSLNESITSDNRFMIFDRSPMQVKAVPRSTPGAPQVLGGQ